MTMSYAIQMSKTEKNQTTTGNGSDKKHIFWLWNTTFIAVLIADNQPISRTCDDFTVHR